MYVTISADVVSSTSLSNESMIGLNEHNKKCWKMLETQYLGFWSRIVRGDTIECVFPRPEDALEAALVLKYWFKSFETKNVTKKSFCNYILRVTIGIGEMNIVNDGRDMMDGDAIYRFGLRFNQANSESEKSEYVLAGSLVLLAIVFLFGIIVAIY